MPKRTVKPKEDFVEAVWIDANRSTGWTHMSDIPKVVKCVTRGWEIYEDDEQIVLAGTTSGDGEYGEVIAIPKGMLVSKTVIRAR